MKITYLGHATLSIEIGDKTILVDPFISGNELAKHIEINQLRADYILITHAHQDHILDVENIAKRTGSILIANFEIITFFEKKGLSGHSMNIGGSWQFDFGTIHVVNAMHSSSFPDGTYGGNPIGFVLETSKCKVYIAGDTALSYEMKLIPEMIGVLDLAILPIGDNYTMGIDSAIQAADFVKCNKVLGVHFDTFESIKLDHLKAKNSFKESNKELYILPIGESLLL